jgi:hypothetical protein
VTGLGTMTDPSLIIARLETYVALQREHPDEPMAIPHLATEAAKALREYERILYDLMKNPNLNPYDGNRCIFCNNEEGHEPDCEYKSYERGH